MADDDIVSDIIHNPSHYTWHPTGIQAIDVIEWFPHNLAASIGYIWRCDYKGSLEDDLNKSIWHIKREMERRQSEAWRLHKQRGR